jgi:hypothetical protein
VSFGLFTSGSTVDRDASVIINAGSVTGGVGGPAGVSAPGAPLPERDGLPGNPGAAGSVGQSHECATPTQC